METSGRLHPELRKVLAGFLLRPTGRVYASLYRLDRHSDAIKLGCHGNMAIAFTKSKIIPCRPAAGFLGPGTGILPSQWVYCAALCTILLSISRQYPLWVYLFLSRLVLFFLSPAFASCKDRGGLDLTPRFVTLAFAFCPSVISETFEAGEIGSVAGPVSGRLYRTIRILAWLEPGTTENQINIIPDPTLL